MSGADWEGLKEEICTQLLIGKENGEADLETIARIVWLERQKFLTLTISEWLEEVYEAALEMLRNLRLLLWIGNAASISPKASFLNGRPARARFVHLVLLTLRTRPALNRPGVAPVR
jgi:hypothetical protein